MSCCIQKHKNHFRAKTWSQQLSLPPCAENTEEQFFAADAWSCVVGSGKKGERNLVWNPEPGHKFCKNCYYCGQRLEDFTSCLTKELLPKQRLPPIAEKGIFRTTHTWNASSKSDCANKLAFKQEFSLCDAGWVSEENFLTHTRHSSTDLFPPCSPSSWLPAGAPLLHSTHQAEKTTPEK